MPSHAQGEGTPFGGHDRARYVLTGLVITKGPGLLLWV